MKYRFRTKPREPQLRSLKFLLRNKGGGLQVPMRWGKTKVAIDFAGCMNLKGEVQRVLVICPISAMGGWEDEIEKHQPDEVTTEWLIVNFEAVYARKYVKGREWKPITDQGLLDYDADLVIVDESHRIGNPTAVQSKHCFRLGDRAKYRVILTGTMFDRKPFFVFGQMRFLDPSIFGTAFGAFKNHIAVYGGYMGYEVKGYQNLEWMMDKVKQHVWIEKDVPPDLPPVINEIRFNLTGDGLQRYREMEKESITEVNGAEVVADIVLTRHLRLCQIAGGWIRHQETGQYRRVSGDTRRVGSDRIREYSEQGIDHVVVGCRFLPELVDVARVAEQHGYEPIVVSGRTRNRKGRIRRFQRAKKPAILIAQFDAVKEGVDLSRASVMLFWSLPMSFVTYKQFRARIQLWDDDRTLMYDYLLPTGTRTEVAYEALGLSQDVAHFLVHDPKRVEEITSHLGG